MSSIVILLFIDMLTAYQVARSYVQLHVGVGKLQTVNGDCLNV